MKTKDEVIKALEEMEEELERLKWRIQDLEDRVFGSDYDEDY